MRELWVGLLCVGALVPAAGADGPAGGEIRWEDALPAGGGRGLVVLPGGVVLAPRTVTVPGGVGVLCARSSDAGRTWEDVSTIVRAERGTDLGDGHLVRTAGGELLYSYRCNRLFDARPSYSIRVAASKDGGATWAPHSVVESVEPEGRFPSRGLWSSFLLELRDGTLQCYYDDENAPFQAGLPGHQWVQMRTWDPELRRWVAPVTVSRAHDPRALSRDGMASVVELPDGRLLCAFESVQVAPPHANLVRLVESADGGRSWSWLREERRVLYQPADTRYMALAPWMVRLQSGRLLCLFCTDEDREKPDRSGTPPRALNMDLKCVTSSDDGRTWSPPAVVDAEGHKDYLPGVAELRPGELLAAWWDTLRGLRCRRGTF